MDPKTINIDSVISNTKLTMDEGVNQLCRILQLAAKQIQDLSAELEKAQQKIVELEQKSKG